MGRVLCKNRGLYGARFEHPFLACYAMGRKIQQSKADLFCSLHMVKEPIICMAGTSAVVLREIVPKDPIIMVTLNNNTRNVFGKYGD